MLTLKGSRYVLPDMGEFPKFLTEQLPYFDLKQATSFYDRFDKLNPRPQARALLNCNDRFYLLTRSLGRADANHPWLYDRCREVYLDPDGYLDLWSREHYKSTIITFAGIIQEVLSNPEITVGIFSHQKTNAQAFLKQIMQEFEVNELLQETHPDVLWAKPRVEAPKWSLSAGIVVKRTSNPKEATIEATGLVDGMPTGKHYQLMVYDDVVTEKSVTNPEQVKRTTEAWELSDNLGAGEVRKWHIGTRYSFGDTYGIILNRGIKPRIYPATDNGKIDGKPVFMSEARWKEKIATQRSTLSAQMLQNPIAGQENVFKPEWFRTWEVRPQNLTVCIMGDPSGGQKKTSDRTALVVVGIDRNGNKFLLDGFAHRMSLSERWNALRTLYRKWSNEPGVVGVQVGYERYGMQSDLEYFQERMLQEDVAFQIEELNWPRQGDHSKLARVERLEPDIRLGRFYFPCFVFEPGRGDCFWSVDEATSTFIRTPVKGFTKQQQRLIDSGHENLVCKSIKRRNEDGAAYCVTSLLVEEAMYFPFSRHDDVIDALSRVYDMNIALPVPWEDRDAEAINTRDWEDA